MPLFPQQQSKLQEAWHIIQSISHRHIHTNRRQTFTHIDNDQQDYSIFSTCVAHSWTTICSLGRTMSSDKRLPWSQTCIILGNSVYVIISEPLAIIILFTQCTHTISKYIHQVRIIPKMIVLSHSFSILKIHTLNAHYSTNGVIITNHYCNLETHTLNAHCPQNNLIIIS